MQTVLVVDDDPALRASLDRALRRDGYVVSSVADGLAAIDAIERHEPDAIVLDVGLPIVDGLSVCRRLRADGFRTPVLMLTARDAVSDRVAGLDAGADDYLVKPFALAELYARLRALLRRTGTNDSSTLRYGDLTMQRSLMDVRRGERSIELTRTEYRLLELLLARPQQVLDRATIVDGVWGYQVDQGSNSLDVYIGYLRRKLEADGEARLIHTVRGVGYVLREP
ncbi:MAG: response regulator transcription factor [Chloroflexota bacterium]